MAYRNSRSTSRRSASRKTSPYSSVRNKRRSSTTGRRSGSNARRSSVQTVRLVIEQPQALPLTEGGQFAQTVAAKKAAF